MTRIHGLWMSFRSVSDEAFRSPTIAVIRPPRTASGHRSHYMSSRYAKHSGCIRILAVVVSLLLIMDAQAQTNIDLSGQWYAHLDPTNEYRPGNGSTEVAKADGFAPVGLPGALRDSGLGDPVGPDSVWIGGHKPDLLNLPKYKKYQTEKQFKFPFWLQPERHYVGAAFYQRMVDIPNEWHDKRVVLFLERPHWQTEVFVDGRLLAKENTLSTPHVFDLTAELAPGQHLLTIRVDNSLDKLNVGINSHSVSDHTQSAWHGIVGTMELRARPKIAIADVQVFPAADARSARVRLRLANMTDNAHSDEISIRVFQDDQLVGETNIKTNPSPGSATVECELAFDKEAKRWDEFAPNLCRLEASLQSDRANATKKTVFFGVRHIRTEGTQFVLNGRPLYLRGTLECCIFPLTGYPPTDVPSWERVIRVCKSHGLNHIRFHSWCPPEAAFVAADKLGFYFQVECSSWPNQGAALGNGKPIDDWLYREGERILARYGNHPSFLLLAMGNEPAGPPGNGTKYLGPWVEHFKAKTDRQLITAGSGWPSIRQNEFHVTPAPRIQQWGQGVGSRINARPPATMVDYRDFVSKQDVPVISHEIGQWCVYPNFNEMRKYTGSLKPKNFEIFRDFLSEAGMLDQAHDFLMASGKLQTLCYKEEIESALRTPGFGGFQLLDLHDFPGQGTALVGMVDPFWDSKPYLTPDEFSRFCGPTIPLARMPKRVWTRDEKFVADIEVAHFGPRDLVDYAAHWSVKCDGEVRKTGKLSPKDISTGTLTELGTVEVSLSDFNAPQKLSFVVSLGDGNSQQTNDWDIWVYPAESRASGNDEHSPRTTASGTAAASKELKDTLVVRTLTDTAMSRLENGEKVVLFVDPNRVDCDVQIGFSSIFWNTAWTGGQAPHTLGILCDPSHPALAAFPTDYHTNWQWWELISRSKPMLLDKLPAKLRPLVQVVPDWFQPQRLGLVIEANVGKGKLLVCSIDLVKDLDQRPVAVQMRRSLLKYAASDRFAPQVSVTVDAVRKLFREPTTLQRLGASVQADSSHSSHPASNAIDGNPKTIWHTEWEPTPAPQPHTLVLDLKSTQQVAGVTYLPRQDMPNGRIAEFAIHVSKDGLDWGEPVATGTISNGTKLQVLQFSKPQSGQFVKLISTREVNGKPFAGVAEVDVLLSTHPK